MATNMRKVEFDFTDAIVNVKLICINPCASDEYIVTVSPKNGKESVVVEVLGGLFETDKMIAERVYNSIQF